MYLRLLVSSFLDPPVYVVAQLCPTLCHPMGCNLPGSSVHGILQAGILEWLPFLSPRDLPNPGIGPGSPLPTCWPLFIY